MAIVILPHALAEFYKNSPRKDRYVKRLSAAALCMVLMSISAVITAMAIDVFKCFPGSFSLGRLKVACGIATIIALIIAENLFAGRLRIESVRITERESDIGGKYHRLRKEVTKWLF